MGQAKEAVGAEQAIDEGAGGGGLDAGSGCGQSSHLHSSLQPEHDCRPASEKGFTAGDSQKHSAARGIIQPANPT